MDYLLEEEYEMWLLEASDDVSLLAIGWSRWNRDPSLKPHQTPCGSLMSSPLSPLCASRRKIILVKVTANWSLF